MLNRLPFCLGLLVTVLLWLSPAGAQTVPEKEPNDRDAEAMVVTAGNVVNASWSYARSKETKSGTDRDDYRLTGFTYPGTYTFTVTPSTPECPYWFGITNTRGLFSGTVTLTVAVEKEGWVTYSYSGGGQNDFHYMLHEKNPLNNQILIVEPAFWDADHDGGFQCAKDGAVRTDIPYQLSIVSSATPTQAGSPAKKSGLCVNETEPNDRDREAMSLPPAGCIDASWSYARSKETKSGTDRDVYRLTGFTYPATYTFTVTPSTPECPYWFGLKNARGPFSGVATLTVAVDEQNKVTYTYSGGNQPEYWYVFFDTDPLNDQLLVTEPALWDPDHEGGFQCVRNGPVRRDIPYRLTVAGKAAAGNSSQSASQERAPSSRQLEAPKEISLAPGETWEGEVRAAPLFEIMARIQWEHVMGMEAVLEVRINGQPVSGGLVNKNESFRLADGRRFPYYDKTAHAWTLFFSPDFSSNESSDAGDYEVVTDPGEAYRFRWITGVSGGAPMKISFKHNGRVELPIIIQYRP